MKEENYRFEINKPYIKIKNATIQLRQLAEQKIMRSKSSVQMVKNFWYVKQLEKAKAAASFGDLKTY